jgi:gamma-glutamylputrescine oxidase
MQIKTYPALSYWEKEVWFKDVDVVIVGGGIVGLNAAWQLKQDQKDLKVLVIEQGSLPAGASTRNAGFACFGSLTELLSDQRQMGETAMFDLVAQRYEGLIRMREKLGDEHIGYREWGGYELFREPEESLFSKCKDAIPYFNQRLQPVTGLATTYEDTSSAISDFGFKGVNGLIRNKAEGQIHTGRMMYRLETLVRDLGVNIINGLSISGIEDNRDGVLLQTAQGWELPTKRLIVATNGFAKQLLPVEAVEPARNQVLITEPIPGLSLKGCFHYDQGYYYFRNINGRILLGGGRNLAFEEETTHEFGINPVISKRLLDLLHHLILPGQNPVVEQWWSGIMGVGDQKKPIVRKVSPNVTIAIRLGGMGVAIGSWVGEEAARKCFGVKRS